MAITFVSPTHSNASGGGATTITTSSWTSGAANALVAIAVGSGQVGATAAQCTVSDSQSGTWVQLASFSPVQDGSSQNYWVALYYRLNITGGTMTVTASNPSSIAIATGIVVGEFQNVVTSSPLDGGGNNGAGSSSGTTISVSGWATSASTSMTVGAFLWFGGSGGTAGTGYTLAGTQQLAPATSGYIYMIYGIQTAGTVTPTLNTSAGSDWCAVAFALKQTAATPPTVTSCTPSSGTTAGGTSITNLAGTGFVSTPTVTFGGVAATSVAFVSSTKLTCTTPAHSLGSVDIVVTNPSSGGSGTLTNGYTYTSSGGGGGTHELLIAGAGT